MHYLAVSSALDDRPIVAIGLVLIGVLFAAFFLLLCLAWSVKVRCRKFWEGPVAFRAFFQFPPWGQTIILKRQSPMLAFLRGWVTAPMKHSSTIAIRQFNQRLAFLNFIAPALAISRWHVAIELGFQDPSLTGEYLGLLSAMPPNLQRSLRLTFEQEGVRFRGDATFTLRPIALLLKICAWWWTQRRSLVA